MSFPSLSRAQRIEQLRASVEALSTASVGSVFDRLAVLGDLLRHRQLLQLPDGFVDAQAARLEPQQVERSVPLAVLEPLTEKLNQAADEAMEGFLSDDAAEQEQWQASAAEGLAQRDRLQSVLRALEVCALHHDGLVPTFERFEAALQRIDRAFKPKIRYFIPLNAWRRDERELLDPGERLSCPWFTLRADCDALLSALGSGDSSSPHLASCQSCREDLAVPFSPPLHLTSELAFELDLGLLDPKVEAHYRGHCARCAPCHDVLSAIEAGDRAIDELSSSAAPALHARRRDEEVLEDTRNYRVLLRRKEGRLRLVLTAREGRSLSSATLVVPSRRHPIAAQASAAGLEFDLGPEDEVGGSRITLRFKLSTSDAPVESSYTV